MRATSHARFSRCGVQWPRARGSDSPGSIGNLSSTFADPCRRVVGCVTSACWCAAPSWGWQAVLGSWGGAGGGSVLVRFMTRPLPRRPRPPPVSASRPRRGGAGGPLAPGQRQSAWRKVPRAPAVSHLPGTVSGRR